MDSIPVKGGKPRAGSKARLLNSALTAASTAVALAAIHSGCGHDVSTASGYTTVHIGNGAAESMAAARKMNLLDQFSSPPEIETAPVGGIMVMAQLIGGGPGSIFVPNASAGAGVNWTIPNGAYNFIAVGYDGAGPATLAGQSGPYCGLAQGDTGRGTSMVLAGTSRTVDILMGPTITAYVAGVGAGNGSNGSANQGTTSSPTCAMSPFMPSNPAGATGCTGSPNGSCFMPSMSLIGICNGASGTGNAGLPAGSDVSGSNASTCSNLAGPAGNTGATPVAAVQTISSLMIQFAPINNLNGNTPLPAFPLQLGNTLSICINNNGNALFNSGSAANGTGANNGGIPVFPAGGGQESVGGPSMFTGGYGPNFSMPTFITIFNATGCPPANFLRTYVFPYGINQASGSTPTGLQQGGKAMYVDNGTYAPAGVTQSADTMAGFWVSGSAANTAGKLWIQYP